MPDPKNNPPFEEAEGEGVPTDGKRNVIGNEQRKPPDRAMSGAVEKQDEPLKNPTADRNPGRRQAGMTPRPTDKPITGGSR